MLLSSKKVSNQDELYNKANYFIQVIKNKPDQVVIHISEYDSDYKIYYDCPQEDKYEIPSTYWIIDKEKFHKLTQRYILNKKLKKVKTTQ